MFTSQNVLAQDTTPPYVRKVGNAAGNAPITACNTSRFDFVIHPQPAPANQFAANTDTGINLHYTTIIAGDTLWDAVKRILMDYVGQDPCRELSDTKIVACHNVLDQKINKTALKMLDENGFLTAETQSAIVLPGQTVWVDASGAIWIEHQNDQSFIES